MQRNRPEGTGVFVVMVAQFVLIFVKEEQNENPEISILKMNLASGRVRDRVDHQTVILVIFAFQKKPDWQVFWKDW